MSGDVCVSIRKDELAKLYLPARICPVCCGREHRRERAQNIQHRFPRRACQLVDKNLLILGADLVEAELPELRKNVRVEMRVCGAHRGWFSLCENFLAPADSKFGNRRDASWLIRAVIDAGEDFVELAGCKPLRRQFFLRAEHDLRPRADDSSIRSNRILPVPA